jgi:hypothetical protein
MSSLCRFKLSELKSAFRIPKSAIYNVLVFLANVGILAKNFRAAGEVLVAVR